MLKRKNNIRSLTLEELKEFFVQQGDKAFRGKQVYEWLWKKSARRFDEMTNLATPTRTLLDEHFCINHVEISDEQKAKIAPLNPLSS